MQTQCPAGTASPKSKVGVCEPCEPGRYQSDVGATGCALCTRGSYCKTGAAVHTPCASGSYSNTAGLKSQEECKACPLGWACAAGATTPETCAAGRYGTTPGQASRECSGPCAEGHYCLEGSTSSMSSPCRNLRRKSSPHLPSPAPPPTNATPHDPCLAAAATGRFNRVLGGQSILACIECDASRFSVNGSAACELCATNYFRPQANSSAVECSTCNDIQGVTCALDTTTPTLKLDAGYWRHSAATTQTHRCKLSGNWTPCAGGVEVGVEGDAYCATGYRGPRCELCDGPAYTMHFDKQEAICHGCDDIAVRTAAVSAAVLFLPLAYVGIDTMAQRAKGSTACEMMLKGVHGAQAIWRAAGMRYKLKALVGFYQCLAAAPSVFDVEPPAGLEQYSEWIYLLELPSELENILVPGTCLGNYRTRILIGSLWPIGLVLLYAAGLIGWEVLQAGCRRIDQPARSFSTALHAGLQG
eukprot:7389481-Prymnesium_polylepis.2